MNSCICCGAIIPEGRQVCPICEGTAAGKMIIKQRVNPKPYENWTLAEAKAFCAERGQARKDGYDPCDGCPLWVVLCATEYPEKWNLNGFTPEEVEAAKAVKKLWPEAEALSITNSGKVAVMRSGDRVPFNFLSYETFPSIYPSEIVFLDDIIGEG